MKGVLNSLWTRKSDSTCIEDNHTCATCSEKLRQIYRGKANKLGRLLQNRPNGIPKDIAWALGIRESDAERLLSAYKNSRYPSE